MKKYTFHAREILVTPFEVEANSLEEAKEKFFEGDGEWVDRSYPSALDVRDILDDIFEEGFVDGEEIPFEELNDY